VERNQESRMKMGGKVQDGKSREEMASLLRDDKLVRWMGVEQLVRRW